MTTGQPRNFDHSALVGFPEYHALRRAVDALGCRLDHPQSGAEDLIDREGFIEVAGDMARTSYAADCCSSCREMCWPIAAKVKGTQMTGVYYCPDCHQSWTCGYTTNLVMLQGMP